MPFPSQPIASETRAFPPDVESMRPFIQGLDPAARAALRPILWADMTSEYDAYFLAEHLAALPFALTPEFQAAVSHWAQDEEHHYLGFRAAFEALFPLESGRLQNKLAARRSAVDFGPLARLFRDEFHIALLIAYDELATVRAYRANRASYAQLGPEFLRYVADVTADEGRHFASFLRLLRSHHRHRFGEAREAIQKIRATEGLPYANTFVLDHDDDVWSDTIFDEAQGILLRRLAGGVASGKRPERTLRSHE